MAFEDGCKSNINVDQQNSFCLVSTFFNNPANNNITLASNNFANEFNHSNELHMTTEPELKIMPSDNFKYQTDYNHYHNGVGRESSNPLLANGIFDESEEDDVNWNNFL